MTEQTMLDRFPQTGDFYAAWVIAQKIIGPHDSIERWMRLNEHKYEDRVHLMKALRKEFDLTILEARDIALNKDQYLLPS